MSSSASTISSNKITINARGTKIEIPYDIVKTSDLINTWFGSLDENELKNPELFVNFSPEDVHKFLDYVSYGTCSDDEKIAFLCAYFGLKTNINPNNCIMVEKVDITCKNEYVYRGRFVGDSSQIYFWQMTLCIFQKYSGTNSISGDYKTNAITCSRKIPSVPPPNVIKCSSNGDTPYTLNEINILVKKKISPYNKKLTETTEDGSAIIKQIFDIVDSVLLSD